MNVPVILSNLKEAEEELRALIAALESAEDVAFESLHVSMAHAYHHLNTAWNARHATDEEYVDQTTEDFRRWERFPTDLPLIGDDAFYDHPEYGAAADD